MTNKYLKIAMIAVCVISVFSIYFICTTNRKPTMVLLSENESAFDYAADVGSYSDLVNLLDKYPDANQLNQRIEFTYLKKNVYGYRTTVKTDTGFVIIYFSPDTKLMGYQPITISEQSALNAMLQLEAGLNLSEVRMIDPNANYNFLYAGSNKIGKTSFHYFPDGNVFEVYYSEQLDITEIAHYII